MQNEKELMKMIKESHPQHPGKDFIQSTENMLRQKARSMTKTTRVKKYSLASSLILFFAFTFSWLFFFNGSEAVINLSNTIGRDSLSSTALNDKEPIVFIYQTHNVESFIPELEGNNVNKVYSEDINVTSVGKELETALEEREISAIHDDTNISEILVDRNLTFADSYTVSREIIQRALNEHQSIMMLLDIHRDASKKSESTITIDGMDFAKIGLVVSKTTENYEANKAFASRIHEKLEQLYPGLSQGVFEKGVNPKNTYNQDLQENSVLLNIGGVENTFEETYRTADALAEVIKEIIEEY
ncbi:stage II sporulation protein P [Ureibacillus aquaedulcis]|uniref:Stage II sporulation protein P n=1 Tax=Ureibacillus aquaedulcis TaxID=3058421 RepID=A0ABT8GMC3_9BACL|nr:stage II sporulation protein P [Ureibacillus sp. BA0131]MDN4492557.1 stage II sporulation protein P [Ureibacillus sp. BA0131]